MNIKTKITFILTVCFSFFFSLHGEVERVTVKWDPVACRNQCARDLTNQLIRMPGLAELTITQNQGQADIRWKPYAPFSFDSINSAMRLAGPRLKDVRVKVRGAIGHSGNNFFIKSLGDNTQFTLLSPARVRIGEYLTKSLDVHVLAPEMRQKLLQAEREFVVAVIEGPLFEPTRNRGLALYLIIEQITFNKLGQGAIPARR